jgi:hypothetical protein
MVRDQASSKGDGVNLLSLTTLIAVPLVLAGVIAVAGSFFMGHFITKYKITENSIEVIIFQKFRVWKIPFQNICDVRIVSWKQLFQLPGLYFYLMSRPFARYVVLRRRGIFKNVLITPDNPHEFVRIVREKIGHPTNSPPITTPTN